jgi:iron complex outermembrane receptor protein
MSLRINALFGSAAAAALCASTPALAFADPLPPGESWVGEVVVTGARGTFTAQSAATATRTLTPIEEVPQSIQALTRTLIEEQDLRTLGDVLTNVSGVTSSSQAEMVLQAPKIRGFDAAYFTDGVQSYNLPASASDTGALVNIARVEVAKGPTSTLYGGGTGAPLSGIINLVSANPAATASARIAARYGAFDTRGAELEANLPLGALRLRIAGDYEAGDSYLDAVNHERWSIFPTAAVDLGTDTTLTVRGQYARVAQLEYAGLPVALIGRVDDDTFAGSPDAPRTVVKNRALTATLSHRFSDNWRVEVTARRFANNFAEFGSFPFTGTPVAGTSYIFAAASLPSRVRQSFVTAAVDGQFTTGSVNHHVLLGADYDHTNYTAQLGFGPLGLVDYARPSTNVPFVVPALSDIQTDAMRSTAAFVQDQVSVGDRLDITGSLRWTRIQVASSYVSGGFPFVDTDRTYHRVTPRLGATYRLTDGVSAFAGYAEGFKGLVAAFGVADPRPETSKSYEAGLKLASPVPGLTGTVAAYHVVRRNVITADPANPFGSIQSGEQRARGFEADVAYEPGPQLSILAAFAYTDAEVTKDNRLPVGDSLTRVPKTSLRLAARYRFQNAWRGLELGGGLTAVSSRELTLPNTARVDGSVLLDAQASYDFGWATLSVSIVNLTDADDYAPYQYLARAVVVPLQPRSAFVTVRKTF